MNDINFWKEYNEIAKKEINKLIQEKDNLYIDFHMHSNYSTDGKQNLNEIVNNLRQKDFDIISITDHDNIDVYNEVYELINKEGIIRPIIIPGIEFTTDCRDYGSQCHILQYYINPKENELLKNIEKNQKAGWKRAEKQFRRIEYNKALQYFSKKNNITLSMEEYKAFLISSKLYIPEYTTLIEYIKHKLLKANINVLEVFDKLEEFNEQDLCEERKRKKQEKYKYLRKKYYGIQEVGRSTRLLLSILAVKGIDDDYYEKFENSGSLSVNEYGQIKIEELDNKYLTIFAHPNAEKFDIIKNMEKYNKNIRGIENNYRSFYNEKEMVEFYKIARKKNFIVTVGSDSHTSDNEFYKNIEFYKVPSFYVKKFNEGR